MQRRVFINYSPTKGSPQGNLKSHNLVDEDLTRYRSIREYNPGDELKRINWKVAAKTGKFATNQFEFLMEAPLFLLLNIQLNEYSIKRRYILIETAISIAASLAVSATKINQIVGLYATGIKDSDDSIFSIPPITNSALPILDALARIQATESTERDTYARLLLTLPYRCSIIYIGPVDRETCYFLNGMAKNRGSSYAQYLADLTQEFESELTMYGIPTDMIEKYEIA